MDDKIIKQRLRDAGLLMIDASKAWPKYPDVANKRLAAALWICDEIDEFLSYDNRPLGDEEVPE